MKSLTFGIYAIDITKHLPERITAKTGRVWEILTSSHIPTHLCEITPSYELESLRLEPEWSISDELDAELMQIHATDCEQFQFMHVSTLKGWKRKELETYSESQLSHFEDEKEVYEAFRDMHQCNHTFIASNFKEPTIEETKHQQVEVAKAYILQLLKGDFTGLMSKSFGLCQNLKNATGVSLQFEMFRDYPNFSGNEIWPIPSTIDNLCHSVCYTVHAFNGGLWEGTEYATERLKFCGWVYNHINTDWI